MKKLLLLLLICLCSTAASAHPGKTDKYGGHKCLKGCEEWGLFYEEYHLHDKDWKPIRVNRKRTTPSRPESAETPEEPAAYETETVQQPIVQTITTTQYVTIVREVSVLPFNPLLLVLLALLMLLFILRLSRKRKEEGKT